VDCCFICNIHRLEIDQLSIASFFAFRLMGFIKEMN